MMNVNLSFDRGDIELLSVALRLHVDMMESLSKAECLSVETREQYMSQLARVPRILKTLSTLEVKRIMYDCGMRETVEAWQLQNSLLHSNHRKIGDKMKIGDHVHAEYDNGEVVTGEVVKVRTFGERTLLTVKCEQGYRSIYTDKCVSLLILETN